MKKSSSSKIQSYINITNSGFKLKMIFLPIFRRSFSNASLLIRAVCSQNAPCKRLFFKIREKKLEESFKKFSAYEADGKTVGFVLNKKNSPVVLINGVSTEGFYLSNGNQFVGSLIIFPHSVFSWHVNSAADVNEDSLTLFKLLEPKIDLLVFGYGHKDSYTPEVRQKFTQCCKKLGIRFEALPSEQAIGTFNFLADDQRLVAAALIPPTSIDVLRFDRSKDINDYEDEDEDEDEKLDAINEEELKRKLLDESKKKLLKKP